MMINVKVSRNFFSFFFYFLLDITENECSYTGHLSTCAKKASTAVKRKFYSLCGEQAQGSLKSTRQIVNVS